MTDNGDVLARICADTRAETKRRRAAVSESAMRVRAIAADGPRGFERALRHAQKHAGRPALIAEIKRASPSGGLIRELFAPAIMAAEYKRGGATCLSVLTEGPHFQGSLEDLERARATVALPVLRKDFILDPWQVYESRAYGADCILLIVAALTDAELSELESMAVVLGMDVLVEVHTEAELHRALRLKTKLIGINNRDLKTLKTSVLTTVELAKHVPPDRLVVSESGIAAHEDVVNLKAIGVGAILVGESLLRHADLVAATRKLLVGA